jgi:hypothetical protein
VEEVDCKRARLCSLLASASAWAPLLRTSGLVLDVGHAGHHSAARSSAHGRKFAHQLGYYAGKRDGPRGGQVMQCIAAERPWAAFDQAKASFVAQETSGGERVGRVEPCRV